MRNRLAPRRRALLRLRALLRALLRAPPAAALRRARRRLGLRRRRGGGARLHLPRVRCVGRAAGRHHCARDGVGERLGAARPRRVRGGVLGEQALERRRDLNCRARLGRIAPEDAGRGSGALDADLAT